MLFIVRKRLSLDATNVAAILNKRVNLASRYNFADLCNLVGFNCKRVTYALAGSLDETLNGTLNARRQERNGVCSNSRNGFGHDHDDIFVSLAKLSVPGDPTSRNPSVEEDLPVFTIPNLS